MMLVLSRKQDESVHIGGSIVVTVVAIQGDKVRLGFEAPREVPVHRGEVWARIIDAERTEGESPQSA